MFFFSVAMIRSKQTSVMIKVSQMMEKNVSSDEDENCLVTILYQYMDCVREKKKNNVRKSMDGRRK